MTGAPSLSRGARVCDAVNLGRSTGPLSIMVVVSVLTGLNLAVTCIQQLSSHPPSQLASLRIGLRARLGIPSDSDTRPHPQLREPTLLSLLFPATARRWLGSCEGVCVQLAVFADELNVAVTDRSQGCLQSFQPERVQEW